MVSVWQVAAAWLTILGCCVGRRSTARRPAGRTRRLASMSCMVSVLAIWASSAVFLLLVGSALAWRLSSWACADTSMCNVVHILASCACLALVGVTAACLSCWTCANTGMTDMVGERSFWGVGACCTLLGAILWSPARCALHNTDIVVGIFGTDTLAEVVRAVWTTLASCIVIRTAFSSSAVSVRWIHIAVLRFGVVLCSLWARCHTCLILVIGELALWAGLAIPQTI